MSLKRRLLIYDIVFYVLPLYFLIGALPCTAIDVYTPQEVFVENGTTEILHCSFKSNQVISSAASVSWSFQPDGSNTPATTIFYFSGGRPYPGDFAQFKERVLWAGDLNKKDASIKLVKAQFNDNGTYTCDVKNPPDVGVIPSSMQLRVVMKEALPQNNTGVIVGAVIGAIVLLVLIVSIIILVIKRKDSTHAYEGCTSIESVSSQATRTGKKAESSTEGSRCSSPSAPVQGPVIYAQLDHSGTKNPNSFHKMEPVVYADIRKP
ncbi:myelin protein zero-like 1 like isoform X1 [Brienomyrus brachyistius]|uniref:myelin protein zero-like 1 like isoform X1 n=1 Tax=Brienomyrus brachyistius TaxID=42636 RepID=UPI0020B2B927|nr:myelin protein zero-like 1 like isoform X1 [Brienomyrus brachyistius]